MKSVAAALLLAAFGNASEIQISADLQAQAAATYAVEYTEGTSPVQKVVELLKKMVEKGKKEAQDERVQFATYEQWCKGTVEKKTSDISDAADKIEGLNADIAKAKSDSETLAQEIAGHNKDIKSLVSQQDNATKVRAAEAEDFAAAQQDYVESIDALGRAIKVMNKQAYDRKQASAEEANAEGALLQASAHLQVNSRVKDVNLALDAFLQQSQKRKAAPGEVDGYEFQSGGIIKLLKEFEQKFYKEKVDLETEETAKKNAFAQLMASLKNSEEDETKDRDKKTGYKQKKAAAIADMTDNLDTTTTTKADDEKYLAETNATCVQKATDFEARQKLRAEELVAVNKATEILAGDDVQGAESEHITKEEPESFIQRTSSRVQQKKATILAALRATTASQELEDTKTRVVKFLQAASTRLHSKTLERVIQPVADTGAMNMIKDMLTGLLAKLQEQAVAEENKKQYCDGELAANKDTRTVKTQLVDELSADIDKLQTSVTQLTEDIAASKTQIEELAAAVKKATEIRQKEKAKNTVVIADAKAAGEAVAKAQSVLQAFYDKAGQATALVQTSSEQPEIFDSSYNGMGESGGVMSMLESIASDFTELESETSSAESAAADEYDKFMEESKLSKTNKEKDVEHWTAKKQEQASDATSKAEELEGANKELDAANDYYKKLQDECSNQEAAFKKEVEEREQTIQALKEALDMLP